MVQTWCNLKNIVKFAYPKITQMARITLYNRSVKEKGSILLRFRLRDGRDVQLFHKSDIKVDLADLAKFDIDGRPKKRCNYNQELADLIKERINLIEKVYQDGCRRGLKFTAKLFEDEINKRIRPSGYQENANDRKLLNRFNKYIFSGSFSSNRIKGYLVTANILERFLIINSITDILIEDVTPDLIVDFRNFLADEWKYVEDKKFKYLYSDMKPQNVPKEPRANNTIANKLKMLKAFFSMLEDADEIKKTPFRKLGRETRSRFLKEQYAAPIALSLEEVRRIINTDVDEWLRGTKDAFLLQCALGCRISDLRSLGMDNIAVSPDGVPYVRYIAKKTRAEANGLNEVKTPLLRFAFDIIKRTDFNLPILRNISGKDGFNIRIKKLLKACGIDREAGVWNEQREELEYLPLHEIGSTKLGRKTNITLLSRLQIDMAITGLHAKGSAAAGRYFDRSLMDIFKLMSAAFEQETYKVDADLNIIDE